MMDEYAWDLSHSCATGDCSCGCMEPVSLVNDDV
jgi:hypothetical protein